VREKEKKREEKICGENKQNFLMPVKTSEIQ
jgi:hypothetical protein